MVYSNVTSYSLFFIRGLSFILLFGALILEITYDGFQLKFERSVTTLFVFIAYALVSGIVVAKHFDIVLSTSISFFEYLMAFYLVTCYIRTDGKPDYPMAVFITQSLVAVIIMLTKGTGAARISISENVNVNTLGVMFAYSIGFILYMLISRENKPIKLVYSIAAIAALLFGIMMTASKKAIIASAIFVVSWIIFCYKFTFAKMNKLLKILIVVGLVVISIYLYGWYVSNYSFQMEIVKNRMSQMYVGESDQLRFQLFKEGFLIFLSHPFFGVGYNNARFYTSNNFYTHSFYSELFACTGIVGVVLFSYAIFRPWLVIGRNKKIFKERNSIANIQTIYILVIFLVLLVLGFVQIIFYTPNLMFVLSIITGYIASIQVFNEERSVLYEQN